MSRKPPIPAGELRSRDRVWLQQPARRGLRRRMQGEVLAVNSTSALVDVDELRESTAVVLLVPATAITHVWRQLTSGSAPSLLPVTHTTGVTDRRRRGWRGGKARRTRAAITKPAAWIGGHEPSERGTA